MEGDGIDRVDERLGFLTAYKEIGAPYMGHRRIFQLIAEQN